MDHDKITAAMGGKANYGKGMTPNPFSNQQKEWERRKQHRATRQIITDKIASLFEPRYITPPETSELIEAIVTASDARKVLELGTHTGFTSLHILRAIYGKLGAVLVSVEARPTHDKEFWAQFDGILKFAEGWTPEILSVLHGTIFDLVFVDSDHSVEHTTKELGALWPLTRKGTIFLFHDVPEWQTPDNPKPPPVRDYLFSKVTDGTFQGGIIPTCEQLDCLDAWGSGYPPQCNPHLGMFIRR